jgi:hypothetical protein
MPNPSPDLILRCSRLSAGAHAVRRAAVEVIIAAHKEGFTFPDLLEHELYAIERSLDHLFLLLKPERLVAQDNSGRQDTEAGAQTPA